MLENPKQNSAIESERDAREPETKRKIESVRDAREPEMKRRDRIQVRLLRTGNKTKGSNPDMISENPKQKDGIESGHNARELESK